ncbi:hypothetical protein D9757_001496 [Collybiopsis confluens]|uniref:Uncharacterized protein n=1 Tax=Collybiopsis confluens TaxID=2823264 RepID=A0A8H5HZ50_9AGAR|nr:hypothetical protein D9757_001496 [Collybiopsis confluens]
MPSHRSHHSQSLDVTRHPHRISSDTSASLALQDLETISETFKSLPSVSETLRELPLCIEKLQQIIDFRQDMQKHAEIDEILESLRADSKQFSEILRLSAYEAEQEYQFSIEMIELCDILMQGGASGKHTGELLETMKERAMQMRVSSSKVAEEFCKVNDRFVETGKNIPIAVGQLVARKQYVVDKKHAAERIARPLKVLRGVMTTAGGVVGVIAGISAIAFPPVALLALSVVFPILSILVNVMEGVNKKRIKGKFSLSSSWIESFGNQFLVLGRRGEERELRTTIKRLRQTSSTLNNMIEHLDAFTQFWQNIELQLADIGDRLAELEYLRTSPSGKIRIEMMRTLWADTNEEYRKYRVDLGQLRSIYSKIASSRSSSSSGIKGTPPGNIG